MHFVSPCSTEKRQPLHCASSQPHGVAQSLRTMNLPIKIPEPAHSTVIVAMTTLLQDFKLANLAKASFTTPRTECYNTAKSTKNYQKQDDNTLTSRTYFKKKKRLEHQRLERFEGFERPHFIILPRLQVYVVYATFAGCEKASGL